MNSAHHRTQQANAAIWATIGVVAMSVAGAALLGLADIAWRSFLAQAIVAALLAATTFTRREVNSGSAQS